VLLLLFSFITEIEAGQPLHNTSETVKYLNNLYKIIPKMLTWYGALQECLKENMHLVSITDPYQQAFLSVQAAQLNSSFWIGLSSQDVSFQFQLSGVGNGMQHFYCRPKGTSIKILCQEVS
jgi:hypothetical protein